MVSPPGPAERALVLFLHSSYTAAPTPRGSAFGLLASALVSFPPVPPRAYEWTCPLSHSITTSLCCCSLLVAQALSAHGPSHVSCCQGDLPVDSEGPGPAARGCGCRDTSTVARAADRCRPVPAPARARDPACRRGTVHSLSSKAVGPGPRAGPSPCLRVSGVIPRPGAPSVRVTRPKPAQASRTMRVTRQLGLPPRQRDRQWQRRA